MKGNGLSGDREELLRRRLAERAGQRAGQRADRPVAGARAARPELSFGQRRIWFIDRLQQGCAGYTIPIAYRLRGDLHIGALHGALTAVTQRHEVLRTHFPIIDDEPYQAIEPSWPGLALEDLSGSGDPVARAEAVLAEQARGTFDLAAGPLFVARLLRLASRDHVLLITVHHSVFDGASLGVLLDELSTGYAAIVDGRRPELGELPLQYAEFAAWQHQYLTDGRLAGHLAYWRERLAGIPAVIGLSTDRPRPRIASGRGRTTSFTVSAATVAALREVGRAHSASLFMVTLAAYQAVLSRYAGTTDVVVGVPVAGREHRELEGMIGFFAQTLPVRTDLSGDPTFAELLDQVRDGFLDASAHQELPFDRLVEHLADTRDLSHSPIVQMLFNMLSTGTGAGSDALRLPNVTVTELETSAATTRFDLELHLLEADDRLDGTVRFAADLFDTTTMSWFAGHYQNMLAAVAADPSARVSRVPIVTDTELELMARWNDESTRSTESEYA